MEKKEPVFGQGGDQPSDPKLASDEATRGGATSFMASAGGGELNPREGGGLWKILVVILLLAWVAVTWFAWHQSLQQAGLLARFDQLASKISSTDESLSQSGAAMSVKIQEQSAELEKHWSEIKKLWGVANDRNRKTLDEHKALLKEQASTLKKTKDALNKLTTTVTAVEKEMHGLKSDGLAASAQFEDVRDELAIAGASVENLNKQLRALQERVTSSSRDNEKAMAAIDSFRRQTNQDLQAIREQLAPP